MEVAPPGAWPGPHARLAGVGYLVIIASGIFAEFFVRSSLIVPGEGAATVANIAASGALYRAGIASELVMLVADVLVAVALYVVFRPVGRTLALAAASFRLAHAAIVAVNLLNSYVPLLLVTDPMYANAFPPDQLGALVLGHLETHAYGYTIGLTFFGVSCLATGWLVLRSRYVPRVIGVLLLFAGTGYLVDSFARTLLVAYESYEALFLAAVFGPALVGELSFALWLTIKGAGPPALARGGVGVAA